MSPITMLTLSPKLLLIILPLLIVTPTLFHFRRFILPHPGSCLDSVSHLHSHEPATSSQPFLQNTTSLRPISPSDASVDHETPTDEIPYGNAGPRIRQMTMLFGSSPNEVDEQSLNTHIEHGKRWGYPTHILRRNIIDSEDWLEFCFSKPLYMLSVLLSEMAKPEDEREWHNLPSGTLRFEQ